MIALIGFQRLFCCGTWRWCCSSEVFVTISDCWKLFLSFLLFLLRVPRWELQIGCEQQAKEGADGIHQRADSRTGDRIRPSQLFDQTEAVRNRRKPGSHGKAGEMTDHNLVPVHQSFCQKLPLFVFFGFGAFLSSCGYGVGLLYSRCFCKISFWL